MTIAPAPPLSRVRIAVPWWAPSTAMTVFPDREAAACWVVSYCRERFPDLGLSVPYALRQGQWLFLGELMAARMAGAYPCEWERLIAAMAVLGKPEIRGGPGLLDDDDEALYRLEKQT